MQSSQVAQAGTMVTRARHIVSALERSALFCREIGRFLRNVPAWERSASFRQLTVRQNRRSGVSIFSTALLSRDVVPVKLSRAETLRRIRRNLRLSRLISPEPRRCARPMHDSRPGGCASRPRRLAWRAFGLDWLWQGSGCGEGPTLDLLAGSGLRRPRACSSPEPADNPRPTARFSPAGRPKVAAHPA